MSNIFKSYKILYELGIAHNDIKPENIVITKDGYLKLIDFGFSKEINVKCMDKRCTPQYAAPEMHQGYSYDNSLSDMYSLGELMCMLTFKEISSSVEERASCLTSIKSRIQLLNLKKGKILKYNKYVGERLLVSMLDFEPDSRLNFNDLFSSE